MGQEGNGTATGNGTGTPGNGSGAVTVEDPPNASVGGNVTDEVNQLLPEWFQIPQLVIQLGLSALILLLAWYASRYVNQMLGRRIARRFKRPSVSRTILRLIRLGIFLVAFSIIFGTVFGLGLGNVALSVTVFSAVIGVVLAPIVGSIISGLFVLADQPYEVGDMIQLVDRDTTGFVEDITLRYTKIFTLDNTFLVVPNGSMRERDVVNFSAEDPRVRLRLDVQVTYEGDLDEARKLIEDAARECESVIEGGPDIRIGSARYPAAPTCYIESFADHGILLRLRYWVREPYKLLTMRSRVQEKVWERLDDADVTIAYPHSHVVFDDTSGQLRVAMDDRNDGRSLPPRLDPSTEGLPAPNGAGRPEGDVSDEPTTAGSTRTSGSGDDRDGESSGGSRSPPPSATDLGDE
ncbi:mechanosensitive ion channel family protein [Halomarina litorea]|uniref:mechanosensitive ion channel family protein n=1 Tax=Halomarina litorea TaxID=2961595 RepID=UPI0020C40F86|nr:mechanosensitive ion channel family protein [Halomarina sp. BCD28]